MLFENFKKFITYYGKDRYLRLTGFLGLSLIAGLLEFVGVALIYPFILLIINPKSIHIPFITLRDNSQTGLLIGLSVLTIFIIKNVFMIFSQYMQNKFVANWKKDIAAKFMEYYIYAPYKKTMQISTSDKLYVIETLTGFVIDGYILRGLNLLTNLIIILMIIGLLLVKFPIPAIATIILVTISMLVHNKYFKKRTAELASSMEKIYHNYKSALIENIYNIKELKILSAEKIFYDKYFTNESYFRIVQMEQGFYNSIPPYIVELLIVVSLLVLACILSIQNSGNNSALIASFAIVVAALFRISPALNRIQTSIININSSREFVKKINSIYEEYGLQHFHKIDSCITKRMDFNNKITLKNINFSYNGEKQVLKNISFEIDKGDFIGIIGLSGAGKSTLADVITGLLPLDSGEIYVDNTKLTSGNYPEFMHIIGYVPQQINILDKSINENVAWGCDKIDEHAVIKALKAAQIYDAVKDIGLNNNILQGANGLSQGQKQRLAIARALYRDPEILIFDEATSALDVKVEHEITEMLTQISSSKTIIAIAHRLSTLKACNKLIYMKDGEIIDIGSFEELSSRYADFANLVQLSSIK